MTREGAISELHKAIDLIKQNGKDWLDERDIPILQMAITALNEQSDNLTHESAQNVQNQAFKMQKSDTLGSETVETCMDTISRQAVFNTVTEYRNQLSEIFGDENELIRVVDIVKHRLIALPSAQTEPCNSHENKVFVDKDAYKRCRFEYINACKITYNRTPDTRQRDINDAYAVIKALYPIFGEESF